MPTYIPISLEPHAGICRFLRSKTGLGTSEGGEQPWLLVDGMTATCWCLRTMEAFGPDEEVAEAAECRVGRVCYEAADPEQ
ncbi:hypothetical protein SAMN00120144_1300 [Hymenobacter roseosalivarius DSM 11622]|uniref:Uncharacterized protein n=1 Tax=Hymenobacter roseosalivarius DSM 11622 TaxID=645990 RepID=A0A1W1W4M5_9BACT|nr:hypothetical protein [Hymenobacter roseosalivarius]SMC00546.1 hypothetical protein SAMN00120144_1300 [Hymenobacter roseosalivarius DSM 11622]